MWRPTIDHVRPYTWKDGDSRTPGLGLINNRGFIIAHLTNDEALQLAHTIADTLLGGQQNK